MVRLNPSEQIQIRMISQEKLLNCLMTEKRSSILTCEKYRQKQIKKCDASHYAARIETILATKSY